MTSCNLIWRDDYGNHRCDRQEHHEGSCRCRCEMTLNAFNLAGWKAGLEPIDPRMVRAN